MSRKDELLKLAELFHSQAKLVGSAPVKQTLRKIGDHYQHEAEQSPTSDNDTERQTARFRGFRVRHSKQAA